VRGDGVVRLPERDADESVGRAVELVRGERLRTGREFPVSYDEDEAPVGVRLHRVSRSRNGEELLRRLHVDVVVEFQRSVLHGFEQGCFVPATEHLDGGRTNHECERWRSVAGEHLRHDHLQPGAEQVPCPVHDRPRAGDRERGPLRGPLLVERDERFVERCCKEAGRGERLIIDHGSLSGPLVNDIFTEKSMKH
jgi:hypothetical protein